MDLTYRSLFDLLAEYGRAVIDDEDPRVGRQLRQDDLFLLRFLATTVALMPLSLCDELRECWPSLHSKLTRRMTGDYVFDEMRHVFGLLLTHWERESARRIVDEQAALQLEVAIDKHVTLKARVRGRPVDRKLASLFNHLFPGSPLARMPPDRFVALTNFLPFIDEQADSLLLAVLELLIDEMNFPTACLSMRAPVVNRYVTTTTTADKNNEPPRKRLHVSLESPDAPPQKRLRVDDTAIDAIPMATLVQVGASIRPSVPLPELKISTSHTSNYQKKAAEATPIVSLAMLVDMHAQAGDLCVDMSAHTNTYACARVETIDGDAVTVIERMTNQRQTHRFVDMRWRRCGHTDFHLVTEYTRSGVRHNNRCLV